MKSGRKILFLVYFFAFGCRQGNDSSKLNDPEIDIEWKIVPSNIINKKIAALIESHPVEEFNFSGNGVWQTLDTSVIIFDNLFRTVTKLSLKGNIIKQKGGLDTTRKNNIWTLPYIIAPYKNGYISIFSRNLAYTDSNFKVQKINSINFKGEEGMLSMLSTPKPTNMTVYELNERNKCFWQASDHEIIVAIESETPSFNPYNSKEYFKIARPFAVVNLRKETMTSIPITRSRVYKDSCCLTVQDGAYLIRRNNEYHIQFAADSLIYVYDKKFKPLYAYGISGNLIHSNSYNYSLDIAFDEDKYRSMESKSNTLENLFLLSSGLVGRIIVNRTNQTKYLQLYENTDLLKEFEIPYDYKYIGVIGGKVIGAVKGSNKKTTLWVIKT